MEGKVWEFWVAWLQADAHGLTLSYFPINSVGATDLFLHKNQDIVLPHSETKMCISRLNSPM